MSSALPFEIPPTGDVVIKSAKMAVNTCFKWKGEKTDASGNIYDPVKVVGALSHALAVLEVRGVISSDQKHAIIKQLMQK